MTADELPPVAELLAAAVAALGGSERPGQVAMAEAVAHALETGEHLAVQAGTGTGKSLAYLVPAIARAITGESPVVVSTATIALQRQLVDRDLPRLVDALADALPRRPRFALLKGRRNYLCLNKIHGSPGAGADAPESQEELFEPLAATRLGRDVARLTAWASSTETGDRDDLTPGVPDRSWSQVSVSARECLGMARCPYGADCFAEKARAVAGDADIVVTNHALLAIDAIAEASVLPEHDYVVVDEAHELVDRVTSVATGELTPAPLGVALRRITRLVSPELSQRMEAAVATFSSAIHDAEPGRMDYLDAELATYLTALRDAANSARADIDPSPRDPKAAAARTEAIAALTEIADTAARVLDSFVPAIPDRTDVVWLDHEDGPAGRSAATRGSTGGTVRPVLRVAPLSVAGLLRGRLFDTATAVLTSATLTIGGSFDAMAAAWGLADGPSWRGLDVGSPFDHAKSGILYIAAHLPPPGRDGAGAEAQLDEIADLVEAAGGRTLGLFSSMRAAKAAAEAMRDAHRHPGVVPGRRQHGRTGGAVRRRPADLVVRHPVAVAGRRRAGAVAVAGADRPHPVSPARRSPAHRPAAGGRGARRQRLHDGGGRPRGAAARAGRRPAAAAGGRPRRGRRAGLPDGHRPLRRLSAGLVAAVLVDHRPAARQTSTSAAARRQPASE